MKIITVIWLSCLIVVSVVLPAAAEDCVFCESSGYPLQAPVLPFSDAPAVAPQQPNNAAVNRYLDAQTNATSESLSIYKYQAGILDDPHAQQKIMIDETMRDLRLRLQRR